MSDAFVPLPEGHDDNLALKITATYRIQEKGRLLTEAARRGHPILHPDEDHAFQARVESATFQQTVGLHEASGEALRVQALDMRASGIYMHDADENADLGDHLDYLLSNTESKSVAADLRAMLLLSDYMQAHNIPGAEQLWRKGNIAKCRQSAPLVRELAQQGEQAKAKVEGLVKDILDGTVTKEAFAEEHGSSHTPNDMLKLEAVVENYSHHIVVRFPNLDNSQLLFLEKALKDMVNWSRYERG